MNAKLPTDIAVFEQVYTSASALLDRAHGDLGVVCETLGFPREVQADLDRLNSYQPIESRSGDAQGLHPPAYTLSRRGPKSDFFSISRTLFAGADHTGRTNPLTHHFVVPTAAVQGDSTLADLLHSLSSLFLSRWDSAPRRLEHPRQVTILRRLDSGRSFPSEAWLRLASLERVAEILGFFAEHMTSSVVSANVSLIFVIPSTLGDDVCHLLTDLLAVLPAYAAFAINARTHVLSPPSIAGQCRVMFTYPNTEFLIQARRRQDNDRPVIIDFVGGGSTDLNFRDYGKQIERALIARTSAQDMKLLIDLRSRMGLIQESSGTPFSDLVSLQQQFRSTEPMHHFEAILTLFENVSRASKAGEKVATSLWVKCIVEHVNSRKINSDWQALALLTFRDGVPGKAQQLAMQAIEHYPSIALPFIFNHPQFEGRALRKSQKWLQKCLEREDVVSSIIQHAVKQPTQQNVECVRKTLLDLKPSATPDAFCNWGRILQESNGEHIPRIRMLIGKFAALKVQNQEIAPLMLKDAISQIVEPCDESERHAILFALLEASSKTNQLGVFVRFIAESFGAGNQFIEGYDLNNHSDIVRAEIKNITTPPAFQELQPMRKTLTYDLKSNLQYDESIASIGRRTSQSRRNSKPNGRTSVGTFRSWCWYGLYTLSGAVVVAFLVLMLEFQTWWPKLRSLREPAMIEWSGLFAFPLSVIFFVVMDLIVSSNTDLTRMGRSRWCLVAALVAMFAGTACTLYTGFRWMQQ